MNLEPTSAKWAARMLTAVLSGFVAIFIVLILVESDIQHYVLPIAILTSIASVFISYPIYDYLYVYCQKPTKNPQSLVNTIKLSSYSKEPFGRYPSDGDSDGQTFRNNFLIPALKTHEIVTIDLDVLHEINSSFIDEAFAGLIKYCDFTFKNLEQRLKFIAKNSDWINEIKWYMQEEQQKKDNQI